MVKSIEGHPTSELLFSYEYIIYFLFLAQVGVKIHVVKLMYVVMLICQTRIRVRRSEILFLFRQLLHFDSKTK